MRVGAGDGRERAASGGLSEATHVICLICGSKSRARLCEASEMFLGTRDRFTYAECGDCGALWLLEPPDLANDVITTTLERFATRASLHHAVFFNDSFEHVPDPCGTLLAARGCSPLPDRSSFAHR